MSSKTSPGYIVRTTYGGGGKRRKRRRKTEGEVEATATGDET